MAPAIMFHHFYGGRHPRGQGAISADELESLIDFVQRRSRILAAHEWYDRALSGSLRSDEVCLTFDDALRCQYDIALPVLKRRGLTAFWFVYSSVFNGEQSPLEIFRYFRTTRFPDVETFYNAFDVAVTKSEWSDEVNSRLVNFNPAAYLSQHRYYTNGDRKFRYIRDEILGSDRYDSIVFGMIDEDGFDLRSLNALLWMDNDCLRELERNEHVIGLHSYSHPMRMESLPVAQQRDEFKKNQEHLANVLRNSPKTMSHPAGSYSDQTLAILRDIGIQIGFRADYDKYVHLPLEFPRDDHAHIMAAMNAAS